MTISSDVIKSITEKVTKEWTRQRKAEERGRRSRLSRKHVYSDRVNFTEVAEEILPEGYMHASGDGRYTVDNRQLFYAVRDRFLELTGREITADYLTQCVLVRYMNQHPEETASWKITASPRGTLTIPNCQSDVRIPCGTIAIEEHLRDAGRPCDPFDELANIGVAVQWPSVAEGQRYQAVLYIEKEGFDPQLREARIADRFDLAIISCKGQSVTAARMYVDQVCRMAGGVPLFVAHDFDKYGFEISQRLTTISEWAEENDLVKYRFKNPINVTDLGLRLADIEKYSLKSEQCTFKGKFPSDTIATPEEQEFLMSDRRVELNAFTAPQFIEWLEMKLSTYLPGRLIPSDAILEDAYRRALVVARVNRSIADARGAAIDYARSAVIPPNLRQQLKRTLDGNSRAWDSAIFELARKAISANRAAG